MMLATREAHPGLGGILEGCQVLRNEARRSAWSSELVIVGEAKAIHMALTGDGKGEIGATEGILEPHVAARSPGLQQHTSGD